MTYSQYKHRTRSDRKKQMQVVQHGRNGSPALVAYDSIQKEFQQKIIDTIGGDPYKLIPMEPVTNYIEKDYKAFTFYNTYIYPDGSNISAENATFWGNGASILNTLAIRLQQHTESRAKHGRRPLYSEFYSNQVLFIKDTFVNDEFPNKLPNDPRRLRQKLESYQKEGYSSLIAAYKGNSNAKKVNSQLEKLILSLYIDPSKPYATTVTQRYEQFIKGFITVFDPGTGEIFQQSDFVKNGKKITLSEATVYNYINLPKNRLIVDKYRNDSKWFKDRYAPHHHRHAPSFTFSKVSLDDRDIPNSEIKAYYAYEILSGCVIGKSWSKDKDTQLFTDCVNDMFLFQHANNLGVPIEVEVEHHLVNRFTDSFMADGALFPLIRWCVPGNSQEKWAETGNRLKKYGFEKGINGNIGRHYAKLEANRPKQVGEWNESRMRIKEKKFTDQEAIENDKISIDKHNNSPHPDFEGMTRLQVLLSNPHPDMPPLDEIKLAFYFGKTRQATIYRTQYIKAHNTKYFLPSADIIEKLSPFKSGKSQLYSYTSPFNTGVVEKVYLFQGDNFICECVTEETYNRSRGEWSEADHEAYNKQKEYVTATREYIKEGVNSISKVQIIENIPDPESETIEVVETTIDTKIETNPDFDNDFYYDGKGRDEF